MGTMGSLECLELELEAVPCYGNQMNQFSACSTVASSFIGRKKEINTIQKCVESSLMDSRNGSIVRLVSSPGSGCTAVLQYLAHLYSSSGGRGWSAQCRRMVI